MKEGKQMGKDKSFLYDDYDEIISNVYHHNPDGVTVEKLGAAIIHLDGIAKSQKAKRLLAEYGSIKLVEKLTWYINQVNYKNYQLKRLKKIVKKAIKHSMKLCGLIPKENKSKRKKALKHLKGLKAFEIMANEVYPRGEEDK